MRIFKIIVRIEKKRILEPTENSSETSEQGIIDPASFVFNISPD
jgi:hypothetical protein